MKINPNRTYTNEEKILITLMTIEEHLKFFKIILIIFLAISVLIWFFT
jgi:hypothetical protein